MKNRANRLSRLRQKLAENGVDAIFISQPENRYYLSGFHGSAGFLLITNRDAILATDFRYTEQAGNQAPGFEIFEVTGDMSSWFPELTSGLNLKDMGVESRHIVLALYNQLSEILKKCELRINLVPLDGLVESLRVIKEPEEIELIRRAAAISDQAFTHIETIIRAGMSEREVAWEVEKFMREHDSEALPFDVIVASGPNAALPHAKPSARLIDTNEPVLIDIGARIEGYCSDLSRTLCLGTDDTFAKIYRVVLDAQVSAMSIIKEGNTAGQVDNAARDVIQQAGYGEAFGHALGHGVGLAPHESPRLGPGSQELLTSGMVFTVEPGIYLKGWGGVRIEDLVIMENGIINVISRARKGKND